MSEPRLTDDSISAIRERADQSVIWPDGEVSQRVSDALWAAVRDRRVLLDLFDGAAAIDTVDVERLAGATLPPTSTEGGTE